MNTSLGFAEFNTESLEDQKKRERKERQDRRKTLKNRETTSKKVEEFLSSLHEGMSNGDGDEEGGLGDFTPISHPQLNSRRDEPSGFQGPTSIMSSTKRDHLNPSVPGNQPTPTAKHPDPNHPSNVELRKKQAALKAEYKLPTTAPQKPKPTVDDSSITKENFQNLGLQSHDLKNIINSLNPYGYLEGFSTQEGNEDNDDEPQTGLSSSSPTSDSSASPYIPYYTNASNQSEATYPNEVLLDKLNYMIQLLEEQKEEKTGHVTEELILYSFLGVFIIFVVDSFARAGKYVR